MNQELNQEQKEKLKTWSEKRDELLLEISNLETAKENLKKENANLALSSTEIYDRMNVVKGRIEELEKQEAKLPLLISKEIASLNAEKTRIESDINNLKNQVKILTEQKAFLEKDVVLALTTFDSVKEEASNLDKIVDHVNSVSLTNEKRINDLVNNLSKSLEEMIEVNRKNVFETNIVIDKVPKMIMEAQKHGLIKNKI